MDFECSLNVTGPDPPFFRYGESSCQPALPWCMARLQLNDTTLILLLQLLVLLPWSCCSWPAAAAAAAFPAAAAPLSCCPHRATADLQAIALQPNQPASPCTSPIRLLGLYHGDWEFSVRAPLLQKAKCVAWMVVCCTCSRLMQVVLSLPALFFSSQQQLPSTLFCGSCQGGACECQVVAGMHA